ncbi:VOC family protein [Vallitalea maricola]|uniref:VOC family protein n=1 Tax=Vallitalea maricola TaxID=3074433 RepID=A0ACB5UQ38_9FIRM|nr:VOC family protein [Vallitalea sp. AN17-2]
MEFIGICLITKDVMALTKFYGKILNVGFEGDSFHTDIKTQGANISIFSINGMEDMASNSMDGAGYGSMTISFKVDNVDEEYERIKELGVQFVKLPQTHPWGSRSFWFRDLDGNIVNFVSFME